MAAPTTYRIDVSINDLLVHSGSQASCPTDPERRHFAEPGISTVSAAPRRSWPLYATGQAALGQ